MDRPELAYSSEFLDVVRGEPANGHANMLKDPDVTIETGGRTFEVRATVVDSEAERRRIYDQHAELHDSFTTYEALADGRIIPVILLERIAVPV